MEKNKLNLLINELEKLIAYGDSLIRNETIINELPSYCKYLDSVMSYIKRNCSLEYVKMEVDNIPVLNYKSIVKRGLFSIFYNYSVNREAIDYVMDINKIVQKMIFRLKLEFKEIN